MYTCHLHEVFTLKDPHLGVLLELLRLFIEQRRTTNKVFAFYYSPVLFLGKILQPSTHHDRKILTKGYYCKPGWTVAIPLNISQEIGACAFRH